jgi:hypothetical protein
MPQELTYDSLEFLKLLVYGDSGSGKTLFLSTMPKPLYIFSFDPNGLESIKGTPGIFFDDYRLFSAAEAKALQQGKTLQEQQALDTINRAVKLYSAVWHNIQELKTNCTYASVAFDSVTFFAEIVRFYIMNLSGRSKNYGKPVVTSNDMSFTQSDFGTHNDLAGDIIDMFLSIPAHAVVTSHGKIADNEDTGAVEYLAGSFGKRFPRELPRKFNEVYRMIVKTRTNQLPEYKLQTRSDSNWPAKTNMNWYNPTTKKQESILDQFETPDFQHLLSKVQTKRGQVTR